MLSVVVGSRARAELTTDLDELFREGARRMLAVALEAEVEATSRPAPSWSMSTATGWWCATGTPQRAPSPPGSARWSSSARGWMTGALTPPPADGLQFQSVILPRWCRRSPKVAEVLPLLYLHGLSSLDFVPALEAFFGGSAGLSASVITRLTTQWQGERAAFARRELSDRDYVYCWADSVHFNLRLDNGRLCVLVLVGVRAGGTKELVAVADGERESADSWAELLRGCRRRGMGAPVVMVGDGALGLWAALREVFPATREQRCWVHKVANVLNAVPKSVQAGARHALNEIAQAEDRAHAERASTRWSATTGPSGPRRSPRTTNPIESTFSPVRARTRVTKGPGNKQAGLAMVFKLLEAAEGRWRAVNGPHLVALVRAGARFEKGRLVERSKEASEEEINEVAA